ncbi:hypothetical protein [Streptomyces lanatus]|uniref:Uncharacterized protein n=1 Tax=Streptomyces lanatus TaxID=66900 RepID=A0ABV1Y0R3_9ACTN|nr:hypothetical protein [Streptomyces lanatus]
MLNRPAAEHAELQDPSADLEVKAARRKWNPALHPRDSKGRFIETGGTVRLWGGKLARVVRALPNDRILVQDQTGPNEFAGRRHTTSAKWVSMVARPDGSAPTDNEDKVAAEDEKRYTDPRRGNGVARDDDGDPDTPNDPHDVDDRGRPIGDDDDPVGPRENDDQDEPADGKVPVHVQALPNRLHGAGARFRDTAAVRQHFLDLAERPGQKPEMAQFLRSVAGDDDPLQTSLNGKVVALRDDSTGRWYLTATGTGQRMDAAGEFATPKEAIEFARHLDRTAPAGQNSMGRGGFDFSDPDLDQAASTWRSAQGENIQAAIKRTRQEFDSSRTTPAAPPADSNTAATVSRGELRPGDRIKATVSGSDIEWPSSTRDQDKPETVTVEGTLAPTFDRTRWVPLLDATLTAPDGTVMTSGDSVRLMRMPNQVAVSGHTDGHIPEKVRADRVRVGDVVAGGEFGHVVTAVRRYPGGRTFTTRHLGGRRETHQFGADSGDTMNVIPRARRRPEDAQRDTSSMQQHPNSGDAKRAAAAILKDWAAVNELAEKQWPDGAPEEYRALVQHLQNVTDEPKGAEGYHQNGEAMRGALASLHELDTDSLGDGMQRALHRLEERLDDNADRFAADAQAIRENKRKRTAREPAPEPLRHGWDNPENLVTLTLPEALADFLNVEETAAMEDPDTRKALTEATKNRNGSLKVTAPIETHRALLEWAWTLAGGEGLDSDRKEIRAHKAYTKRVDEAEAKLQAKREQGHADAPNTDAPDAASGDADQSSADDPVGVILSPDEVNAPAAAARASKAPSAMEDGEIRDEIVSLMEREMANGGELEGTDRTRLRVLEAEEARRAGRKPPEEPKPKPKAPAEEPGGLFDVEPEQQQRFVADPDNPDDLADDVFGTPDMFAAAEGRDTSRLRPPQSRKPADFKEGDRFVDSGGRTHTVAEEPVRTPRGRIRVVDEDGKEHVLAPDRELRVLHPDEETPEVPETDGSEANTPAAEGSEGDARSEDAPETETPAAGAPDSAPPETEAPASDASDARGDAYVPAGAPDDEKESASTDDKPLAEGEWVTNIQNGDSGVIKRVYDEAIGMGVETRRVADVEYRWDHRKPMVMRRVPVIRLTRPSSSDGTSNNPKSTTGPEVSVAPLSPEDETETARAVLDGLPDLPPLPNLTGLSRQDKDDVRRIRGDYAKIRESLDGILAGEPPTGDAREDLRRVREQLDYVAGRLRGDHLPDAEAAQSVLASLLELGQDLDRALTALPEREPETQGDGPNGGTLFHPWDIQDGDLVRFDAENPADRDRSLASYFGTFRGRASAASGDQGRTRVTYERRRWNDDRQQWENDWSGGQHTVTMPSGGLVERFTPEQWDAWQRPGRSDDTDTVDNATAPDAPIRDTSPADMDDAEIQAELEELQAWQNRHVASNGEGPRVQGSAMLALSPVASRRGALHEEQRNRDNARRDQEKKEKKKQERAEALARAEIGKRNDDGSYPVAVDGEDAGTVRQLAHKWRYTNADGQTSPDDYPSRAEAVAALVRNRNIRRENADEDARREQARSEAPEGWALGDRDDVAENDIIRVPITQRDGNGRPYPVGWRQPVRVNSVSRNENGTMVLSVSNLDGSRSDISPVFLSHPDDTFAWASDRTRPEPTPAWRHELRARMADIGDDIATLQNREGLQDPERIQRLQDLIQRVSRGETDDLQGDIRQIRDEAAWLESQFDDPNLELPYDTRRSRSWATAARMKAERDLRYPDFQQGGTTDGGTPESAAPGQVDDFATVRQRYGGDMVSAAEIQVGDWVHTVSADPAYNEPMHMVGRVIHATPLSNGQVRIEVESDVTINGKQTVRTEFALFRGADLVERLPEGNPGREDSSDLTRRIEGANGQRLAAKVRVPEGWRAVDGSHIQPQPGDRFRIALRGRGGLTDREHMNVTVERPAEREGYWRVKGQPLSFRPSDIVAVPDGADAPSDGTDADAPDVDDRTTRARALFGEGMNAVGGESLPEMQELDDRLSAADSADDKDAELRDVADRMDALAEQYELAGPQGELAADRFRRAARIARGEQDERRGDDGQADDYRSTDGESNDQNGTTGDGTPESEVGEQQNDQDEDEQRQDDEENRRQRSDADPDGGAADPDGGGAGTPDSPDDAGDSSDGDGPDNEDDDQDAPEGDAEEDENDEERRRRRRRRRDRGGGNGGPDGAGPGGPGLPHLRLPDFNVPTATGDGDDGSNGRSGGRDGDRSRRPRHRDVDSLRNAWRTGDGLTSAEDTPERRALLSALADREGLALSPEGGLTTYPEPQADGTTVWRFAQARNGTNLPGITLPSNDPEEARALAGRFEEISDGNGDPFDWHAAWGPASVAAWRDGEGRNLPQALRAVQDDYEQERAGAFTLPEDLSGLDDSELEAAYRQGLGPENELRVMAEMDSRDGYVDQRVRAAVPETPPANAEEAEREGRLMDEALGFGDTDVTQPAPAAPGRLRREFDALDEERFQDAMQATGGRMLSPDAEAQGIDPRAVFSGGKYSNRRAKELASPELNHWIDGDDETPGNGRLTYPQYRQRETDRALRAEFADWDEARYRQAVDFTNGYFFKREYKFGALPFDERELFSGGSLSARDRWQQYASEELQEWFDNNGGRQTFGMFKQSRRDNDRAERQQYEEEQQRTADDAGQGQQDPEELREIADDKNTRLSKGGRILVYGNQAARENDAFNARFRIATPGTMLPIVHDDLNGFRTQKEALHAANVLEEHVRDAEGQPFPWDAPDAAQRARTFRGPDGETLADAITRVLSEHANQDGDRWQLDRDRAQERAAWRQQADEWHRQQEADGYTVLADPDDLQPGDEVSHPTIAPRGMRSGPSPVSTNRATVREGDRLSYDSGGVQALGSQQHYGYPAQGTMTGPDGQSRDSREARLTFGVVRRKPRPEEAPAQSDDRNDQGEPEPIGGQPAHWARVEDLVPGDMVRINGTTKRGRSAQRAGYVYTAPVRVEVTRRGRAERAWRTWVTQNPDGTGAAGNIYTSINATAARAEAPDDVVPGSPASGAQAALRSGDLPNQIPADHDGRGLFPGSTVTGTDDREGTVTGATDTTVSVNWSDGNDDTALSPTTVTVTDGQRPDGWTADGHRVTTQNVVSDTDGALLGPVDDVDGDSVTITTADGTITRSAGDLRVTGEVRDDTPDTAPVTGIDEPAAADLKDGDVVVLDLDGHLATVAITSTPSRDGDRVTLQYADTTTGEMGEIDVDARAVLPRAQGPDGGAPDLGPDDAPEPDDDLTVHPTPHTVDPVTGPTVDPDLDSSDRNVIGDHADGPDDDPNAHQAAVRITADLPVTPEQASALATQLRAAADPSTLEGRAALRAADHLDRAAGRTPPAGLDRPRPSNAAQIGEGDLVAMPDERQGDQVRIFRVIDAEDGPGGVRSFLLEDENQQWRRRVVHGAMPVWQLPEAEPDAVTPPDVDDTDASDASGDTGFGIPGGPMRRVGDTPDASTTPATPDEPTAPVARVRPGSLRVGDVIDAPVSRTGYQFNGHRRLTIITEPQRNGWWMQLTGFDEDGNVHDFGLHNGRAVNVYNRNRPTPALPPAGTPRDPNQVAQADVDRIVSDHARTVAARIIDEAVAGTEPPGDIHALREQIAQRLTADALRDARQTARRDGSAALDAAGITGRDRAATQRRLRDTRDQAHTDTVRAALRTINDLEPLPDESDEDLAARARDLLRLIPDQVAGRPSTSPDADPDVTNAVTGHADDAVNALLQQLQAAGVDPGDAERIARILTQQMVGTRQATARRIAARVAAANPDAGRQPGLLARIVALLIRMAKRLAELVKAGARKIAEKYRSSRERLRRLRAFLGRMVRRVRQWPESRRLARLHGAVNLPDADGDSLAARISHWAGLMPEPGRFGQSQRRVTFWRPTTWGQLAAGRLPDRSDRIQWTPDRAADGGPGLTALRHMAALRAAGNDVDQNVTRRLSAALGDDFGDDPHATLQHADDYVASSERRLVNLQAARSGATIPDDEDLEVEITAARAELAAARREYGDLRTRYAAAVPDAVAAALADVRDMGPEGNNAIVFGPDTNPDAERAVRGVQRLIPRAWLSTPEARRLTAVDGDQGRYEPEGQRITVADLADEGMGTAGYALAQHFARHLGDLDAAQRAFWFSRTHTGRSGARRVRPSALDRLLRRQQTQPETGDTLARSVQAMFSGDWYQDDDLRAFLLGLMATR